MEHMVAIHLAYQLGIKSTTHLLEHILTPAEIRDVCKTVNNNLEYLWDNVWDQRFINDLETYRTDHDFVESRTTLPSLDP